MSPIRKLGFAVGLAAVSGAVSATPCDSAIQIYSSLISSGFTSSAQDILSNHPECFAGGSTGSQVQINGTAFQQVTAISQALGLRWAADAPGPRADIGVKGMAASTKGKAWNVWGSVGNNDTRQQYAAANTFTTRNDWDVLNTVIGVDYGLSPTMVFGVSAAFDRGDGSGKNDSPTDVVKNLNSDGYMVAPYIGVQLTKDWVLDASAGFGSGKVRSNFSTETKADRWFAAANLGYERWMGNWQLAGKATLMHGVEDYENTKVAGTSFAGTDAKNTLDQLRLTFQAGYWMNGFMPYASIGYSSDLDRKTTQRAAPSDPIGKNAWVWSVGANFFSLSSGISGGIAYRQEESRDNQKNNSLTANVNFRF